MVSRLRDTFEANGVTLTDEELKIEEFLYREYPHSLDGLVKFMKDRLEEGKWQSQQRS